jgi:hypothetical protein
MTLYFLVLQVHLFVYLLFYRIANSQQTLELGRVLYYQIYIVICVIKLHVGLQLIFFQLKLGCNWKILVASEIVIRNDTSEPLYLLRNSC